MEAYEKLKQIDNPELPDNDVSTISHSFNPNFVDSE